MKKNPKQPERGHLKLLEKQRLQDIEHKISADVGAFTVLLEEGSAQEIEAARKRARADLLKWGQEMQHIAQTLGKEYPTAVLSYLSSVDTLLHCPPEYIDHEKLSSYVTRSSFLKKMF